ncbi:MAG: hypothetical protein HY556_06450 [Euryarchaeota archaeon]|nr:hypothetical protein [Euryarchaeota archaeon]
MPPPEGADATIVSSYPVRARVKWFLDGPSVVAVVPRAPAGFFSILPRLLGSPRTIQVRLDGWGRDVWFEASGERPARDIAMALAAREASPKPPSGENVKDMERRLSMFLAGLSKAGAVILLAGPSHAADEEVPFADLSSASCRRCGRTTLVYEPARNFACPTCAARIRVKVSETGASTRGTAGP